MLNIDNKEFEITKEQIKICNFTNNGIKGFNINIHLEFDNNNNKHGYLNLDAGFEKSNDIINFINREYIGIPFDNDNQYIHFEVFDTEKFLDTEIESEIMLRINNILENKIMASFEINDTLINIKFEGLLDIVNR